MKTAILGLVCLVTIGTLSAGAGAIAPNPPSRTPAAPPAKVAVPSVVGLSGKDAANVIVRAGLYYQHAGFVQSTKADQDGKVASQNPAAGSKVTLKTVVSCKSYRSAEKMAADGARNTKPPPILK